MSKAMQSALLILFIILAGIVGIRYFVKKSEKTKRESVKIYDGESTNEEENPKSVEKETIPQKDGGKLDINLVSIEELRAAGLNTNTSQNIIEYRKKYGCIRAIEEIDNIKGVGAKTYIKIKEIFYIDMDKIKSIPFVKININNDNNREELLTLGFSKKEYDKVETWKKENGSVFSNIELLKILGDERYAVMNDKIKYSN